MGDRSLTDNHMMCLLPDQSQSRHIHSQNVPGATSEENPRCQAPPALVRVSLDITGSF